MPCVLLCVDTIVFSITLNNIFCIASSACVCSMYFKNEFHTESLFDSLFICISSLIGLSCHPKAISSKGPLDLTV